MDKIDKIFKIALHKGDLYLDNSINNNTVIIIDFYNIYCNLIKFNKYKTFSQDTFEICMNKILKKLKNYTLIIVSKNIFEVDSFFIKKLISKHYNTTYIIVEDLYYIKSKNKERDDYTCFLFNNLLQYNNKNVCILSNDKFKNYNNIINNIKPIKLHYISNKLNKISVKITDLSLPKNNSNINRIGFNFY